jgi:hypothetical protein
MCRANALTQRQLQHRCSSFLAYQYRTCGCNNIRGHSISCNPGQWQRRFGLYLLDSNAYRTTGFDKVVCCCFAMFAGMPASSNLCVLIDLLFERTQHHMLNWHTLLLFLSPGRHGRMQENKTSAACALR